MAQNSVRTLFKHKGTQCCRSFFTTPLPSTRKSDLEKSFSNYQIWYQSLFVHLSKNSSMSGHDISSTALSNCFRVQITSFLSLWNSGPSSYTFKIGPGKVKNMRLRIRLRTLSWHQCTTYPGFKSQFGVIFL